MKNETKLRSKLWIMLISFVVSAGLFLSVTTLGAQGSQDFSFTASTEDVYVIENLNLDYQYDESKYEIVPLANEPYAVIKGDKQLLNLLKWQGKPEFYIDLEGLEPGTYREKIQFKGINKGLTVEIYPSVVELRLMEQQTIKLTPTIDLTGTDNLNKEYVVGVPELEKQEVLIRDVQEKLNEVGQVKATVDVSKLTQTTEIEVALTVVDRDGNVMEDINLIDTSIKVTIPVERKVTIINEEVTSEIVVVEEIVPETEEPVVEGVEKVEDPAPKKETTTPKKEEKPVTKPAPPVTKPVTPAKPEKDKEPATPSVPIREGVLSFINIPKGVHLENNTADLKWSGDVKIDLKGFKAGKYEITVNDKGVKKTIKFDLKLDEPIKEEVEVTPVEPTPPTEENVEAEAVKGASTEQ